MSTELSKFKPLELKRFQKWDQLIAETVQNDDGPKIESYDSSGNAIDRIWLPPTIRQIRREVVESGIFNNRSQVEQFEKVYALAHLGEASVCCPLACTEGLIRVIAAVGSDFLKETYLPRLRSTETPLAGAQFVTEQDCGSDIGAIKTTAVPEGEGRWRLIGEKWFCSAIDEYFLIAARPEGASAGTKGVAIFFVPRTLDGKLNGICIKRLKEKIGTRELPTAEIELNGAVGWNIGPIENGFKNLMNYVLNTSRLMNAACGLGFMSRAYLEAENYAQQRLAFGKKITEYPMVQESLAKIKKLHDSRKRLYFRLVAELDKNPQTDFDSDDALWQRSLINLCKYRTAIGATEAVHEAILLLGGNGTIETFSILPRLYRDSLVIETWEGTHNTLALQICRDATKFPFEVYLKKWAGRSLSDLKQLSNPAWVMTHARRFVDQLGETLEAPVF